jgi:hypothetical protein
MAEVQEERAVAASRSSLSRCRHHPHSSLLHRCECIHPVLRFLSCCYSTWRSAVSVAGRSSSCRHGCVYIRLSFSPQFSKWEKRRPTQRLGGVETSARFLLCVIAFLTLVHIVCVWFDLKNGAKIRYNRSS